MDKLLEKIRKSGVLTPDELTELESKFAAEVEVDAKNPKDEVAPVDTTVATPAPKSVDTPVKTPAPEVPEAPLPMETAKPMEDAPSPVKGEMPLDVPTKEEPMPVELGKEPLIKGDVAQGGVEPTTVSIGDLDQVKTVVSTLESKIRALEEVLSKLSVKEETEEEDFGISGQGKTTAGGEPYQDKAAQLVKKMGGYSR
jgi:hypothetical protein